MRVNELTTKIRHIGIIVNDIEKSIEIFKNLFDVKSEHVKVFPPLGTKAEYKFAFIPVAGIELELIEPISDNFRKMLGNPVEGLNHIAFEVKDIEEAVRLMEKKSIRLGHVTKDGILSTGRSKVAYLDPFATGGILIELVESIK